MVEKEVLEAAQQEMADILRKEHWPYENPATLNYDFVDEPMRELCKAINQIDWLKTAECCAGHPKGRFAWSESTYMRLVVKDILHLHNFFRLIDEFNGGTGTHIGDANVQYGEQYLFGIAFHVTFPKCKTDGERDVYIDYFHRLVMEIISEGL